MSLDYSKLVTKELNKIQSSKEKLLEIVDCLEKQVESCKTHISDSNNLIELVKTKIKNI